MTASTTELPVALADFEAGDEVQFWNRREWWTVRALAAEGRYVILTTIDRTGPDSFGKVLYTIIDTEQLIRGPLGIAGYGTGIDTTEGPDKHIDETVELLEGTMEVSHRNRVELLINGYRSARAHGPVLRGPGAGLALAQSKRLPLADPLGRRCAHQGPVHRGRLLHRPQQQPDPHPLAQAHSPRLDHPHQDPTLPHPPPPQPPALAARHELRVRFPRKARSCLVK